MFGRKMEHMLVSRIAQERPPLCTSAESLGNARHAAPLGDQAADIEAPVGIEDIHHPVIALHLWQLVDNFGLMRGKIGTGTRRAQDPDDLTPSVDKRGV